MLAEVIRMPNQSNNGKSPSLLSRAYEQQEISSPMPFQANPVSMAGRLEHFYNQDEKNSVQIEGEILRKTPEGKMKQYWYCLLGKELYVYRNQTEEKHKVMHNIVGVFIKDEPEEKLDASTTLYPFKLIFP